MSAKKAQAAKPVEAKEVVTEPVPVKELASAPATNIREIEQNQTVEVHQRDKKRQALGRSYKKEAMVPVSIAPFYKPYLSSSAMISANGISVYVPCDGRVHKIPATHAGILFDTIDQINKNLERNSRMSDVQKNVESGIGSMKLD